MSSSRGKDSDSSFASSRRWTLPGLNDENSPAYENEDVTRMREDYWHVTEDLRGGTRAMRCAAEWWLPREPREKRQSYINRLRRTSLLNAYKVALDKTTSRPFSKPLSLEGFEGVDDRVANLEFDADGHGTSLTRLGARSFWIGLHRGMCHILVDMPPTSQVRNLAEERAAGANPYLTVIDPLNVLGWQFDEAGNLAEVRILEEVSVAVGVYGSKKVLRVRIVRQDEWELYQLGDKDKWARIDGGPFTLGKIPLVTLDFGEDGERMKSKPVFMDLAWTNLTHWQSNSDQRNILRFARTGLYFAKGFSKEEAEAITIGPNQIVHTQAENADFKVVEYAGTSIEQGRKDLQSLEEKMNAQALRPFLERPGGITATATAVDESESNTQVQQWVKQTEQALLIALELAAEWINTELPYEARVNVHSEFGVAALATRDGDLLMSMRKDRDIDKVTLLTEMKRRGVLSEDVDIDAVIANIEAEAPDLGDIGLDDDDDADDPTNAE